MEKTGAEALKVIEYPIARGSKMLFVTKASQMPMLVQIWHENIVDGDAIIEFHVCVNTKSKPCHMPALDFDISKDTETSLTSLCGLGDAIVYGFLKVLVPTSTGVIKSIEFLNNDPYAKDLPIIQ